MNRFKISLLVMFGAVFAFLMLSGSPLYACGGTCDGNCEHHASHHGKHEHGKAVSKFNVPSELVGKEAKCPICGMKFKVKSNTPYNEYKGKYYFFCNEKEIEKFKRNPSLFKDAGLTKPEIPKKYIGMKTTCPVMGTKFTVKKNTKFSVYKGKYYFFCCPSCKSKFDKNPEKYIKK